MVGVAWLGWLAGGRKPRGLVLSSHTAKYIGT